MVLLGDNQKLSQADLPTVRTICGTISNCVESRTAFVRDHNLDPDVMLPSAIWREDNEENPFFVLYRLLVQGEEETLNRLRLYSHPFSGYDVISLGLGGVRDPTFYPLPDNFDDNLEALASTPHPDVHRYIALIQHIPSQIVVRPPCLMGEIGWKVDGSPVNSDTRLFQVRMNRLYEAGIIDWAKSLSSGQGTFTIVEIGAGHGALALHLKSIIPQATYVICDLPEALMFSASYLAVSAPQFPHTVYSGTDGQVFQPNDGGFHFVPNYLFGDIIAPDTQVDLAINTSSFAEMSEKQVQYYAEKIRGLLGSRGVLFEENAWSNQPNSHKGGVDNDSKSVLKQFFPYRKTLRTISAPMVNGQVPDLWGNAPISEIINPDWGHFKGPLTRIWFAINSGIDSLTINWKVRLRRLLGARMYGVARGCWRAARHM